MRRLLVVVAVVAATVGVASPVAALSQCHASAGSYIAQVYCSSNTGAATAVRAHANCSNGAHRDGYWRTGVNQLSQTSCYPAVVVSYGYHLK
jgi:hypothetical protein